MAFTIPFRDDRGRVVPWGYVFLTDGPTAEEVADLMQRAFGQCVFISAASPNQAAGATCCDVKSRRRGDWQ